MMNGNPSNANDRNKSLSQRRRGWNSPNKQNTPKIISQIKPTILQNTSLREPKQPIPLTILQKDPSQQTSNVEEIQESPQKTTTQQNQESPTPSPQGHLSRSESKKEFLSTKLMNEQYQFMNETVLKFLTDETDFIVIGVLGLQSVGKSTLLNAIYSGRSSRQGKTFASRKLPFKIGNYGSVHHQTSGIDIAISNEKIILLDIQPIFSGSILSKMIRQEPQMFAHCNSYEHMVHLLSLEIGVLMLSICNLVIAVQDSFEDLRMWKYLKELESLKWMIPDVSEITNITQATLAAQIKQNYYHLKSPELYLNQLKSDHKDRKRKQERREKKSKVNLNDQDIITLYNPQEEFLSNLLIVFNNINQIDIHKSKLEALSNTMNKYFGDSRFKEDKAFAIVPEIMQPSTSPTSINFNFIPRKEDGINQDNILISYSEKVTEVVQNILHMKKAPFKNTITQKEWFKNSTKIWEIIKQSPIIAQYNDILKSVIYN